MSGPVYFGIVLRNGRECPQVYHDEVPRPLLVKGSPLVYCTRLDTRPDAEALASLSVRNLFAMYKRLKATNRLPPDQRGERPKAEARDG